MQASTIAEVFVEQQQVRIEIEVGPQDLKAFQNILPDEIFERLTGKPTPLQSRSQAFFERDWVIRADGEPLTGSLVESLLAKRIIRDEVTGEPLPKQPTDAEVVVSLQFVFPLAEQPATLTVRPPLDPQTGTAAANIGFVLYHLGVAVNDFRYLSREELLHLDWSDPWYTSFERKTLRRQFFAPAAAFLYVEHLEVRKEIVFRPKDLQSLVDLGIENRTIIPAERRAEICETAASFLHEQTPVRIDSETRRGVLDRVHFIKRTLRSSNVVETGKDIGLDTALIGAIYVYPIEALPDRVTMTWRLFNNRVVQVPALATDEAGGMPATLETDEPTLVWQNFLTNPTVPGFMAVPNLAEARGWPIPLGALVCFVIILAIWMHRLRLERDQRSRTLVVLSLTMVCGVCGLATSPWTTFSLKLGSRQEVAPEDGSAIMHALLHNVYRAFDYRDEETTYDVLARSVDGSLLTKIYLETRRSLVVANQGGARVKVNGVEVVECSFQPTEDQLGLRSTCVWKVTGSVSHWGHLHQRQNQYRAEFEIRPTDAGWKLHDLHLLDQERLF